MSVRFLFVVTVLALTQWAHAAGPRWVAGASWQGNSGIVNWYRSDVQYYVDAGPLATGVDHATAVTLVDAAAAVWNIAGVPFTLRNGGTLNQDVSSANVFVSSSGLVWPTDVQSTNYTAKQIAVVFDSDGSLTDLLLGTGAGAPSNCRQNAVTESVDRFIQPGRIAHAIVLMNGRCIGPAIEQQLQMRYQLMRAFGRVIGLGWSQVNDNVFTYAPAPTYQQQMHWPIMHPIDIICGLYTYQCLPQPFRLREDDIASLRLVYPSNPNSNPSATQAILTGYLTFPDGTFMSGVNVLVHREYPFDTYGEEAFDLASSVSGYGAQTSFINPVSGTLVPSDDVAGSPRITAPGYYKINDIPSLPYPWMNLHVRTEAINPLYVGAYSVGPYRTSAPVPSGSTQSRVYGVIPGGGGVVNESWQITDAALDCASGDGTESQPAAIPAGGQWSGRICGAWRYGSGYTHASWLHFSAAAGHTATIEVTALDETGTNSTRKLMPLIGAWHGSGATGTVPTLARTTSAFNGRVSAMTQLPVTFSSTESVRLAITDARGDGRPDYTFRARILYADTVTPAHLPAAGGTITISGMGFEPGNGVTVGGVAANVILQSGTQIVATAPAFAIGSSQRVAVTDLRTGGATSITAALTYDVNASDPTVVMVVNTGVDAGALRLQAVSGDSQTVATTAAFGPLTLRVVDAINHPVSGASVTVRQQVSGWQPPCPSSGRCATAPVYGTSTASLTSDASGLITITPMEYAATAAVTKVAATVGTAGYLALELTKLP